LFYRPDGSEADRSILPAGKSKCQLFLLCCLCPSIKETAAQVSNPENIAHFCKVKASSPHLTEGYELHDAELAKTEQEMVMMMMVAHHSATPCTMNQTLMPTEAF